MTAPTPAEQRAERATDAVTAILAARQGEWVPWEDLRVLAPEGRKTVYTEIDDTPFGFDDPRGPAYDDGPSGTPDYDVVSNAAGRLRNALLAEERPWPRAFRMYDPGELVGLEEVARRLGVTQETARSWQDRGALPGPAGAPWRWDVIRDWALATGRGPLGPNAPRWNGVNGRGAGTVADLATEYPVLQFPLARLEEALREMPPLGRAIVIGRLTDSRQAPLLRHLAAVRAQAVRELMAGGLTQAAVAIRLGVAQKQVSDLLSRYPAAGAGQEP